MKNVKIDTAPSADITTYQTEGGEMAVRLESGSVLSVPLPQEVRS